MGYQERLDQMLENDPIDQIEDVKSEVKKPKGEMKKASIQVNRFGRKRIIVHSKDSIAISQMRPELAEMMQGSDLYLADLAFAERVKTRSDMESFISKFNDENGMGYRPATIKTKTSDIIRYLKKANALSIQGNEISWSL